MEMKWSHEMSKLTLVIETEQGAITDPDEVLRAAEVILMTAVSHLEPDTAPEIVQRVIDHVTTTNDAIESGDWSGEAGPDECDTCYNLLDSHDGCVFCDQDEPDPPPREYRKVKQGDTVRFAHKLGYEVTAVVVGKRFYAHAADASSITVYSADHGTLYGLSLGAYEILAQPDDATREKKFVEADENYKAHLKQYGIWAARFEQEPDYRFFEWEG